MPKPGIIHPGNLKFIEGDDKIRTERCMQNLQVVLDQYDCDIHPEVTITPVGNRFGFRIIAKPRGNKNMS